TGIESPDSSTPLSQPRYSDLSQPDDRTRSMAPAMVHLDTPRAYPLRRAMALPTFFIIGAAKAGTTSLHFYLDQHPQIQMSVNKEPNFFSGPENGFPYPIGRVSRLDEYERLFDAAVEVRGEASVGYTHYPRRQGVPERIKELVPEARFIYLVRDPIARSVSQYQYRVAVEGERRSLGEVLGDVEDPYSPCICPSLYASQLDRYLKYFPLERILVIDHAELLTDRRAALRQIFAFLSVDDAIDSSLFDEELNATRDHRVYPPAYARLRTPAVSALVRWAPRRTRRAIRRSIERTFWPPLATPTLDDDLRAQLAELYAGEVTRLRALTGKSFPTWGM
ncbi:MAG: sulfotransferase family protein, partial [Solirubrobacteraceae bacterium]